MSGREEFPDRNRGVTQAGVAPRHESAPTRAHDGSAGGVSTRPSPHEVMCRNGIVIQYGREDIDYESWYSEWMKNLALIHSVEQLESMLFGARADGAKHANSHRRAIEASVGMQSQSQRRAQTGNLTAAAGATVLALRGALEIHALFPECARGAK